MTTIADLPQDVIELIIFFLPTPSILALELACKSLYYQISNSSYIWQLLYQKTFGTQPTPFTFSKWPDLYKLRRKGRLFTWGSVLGGRLGYNSKDVSQSVIVRQGFNVGVCKPSKVPQFDLTIADVSAGGYSFQILTDMGEIYSTGTSWHSGNRGPGPSSMDHIPSSLRHLSPSGEPRLPSTGVPLPPDAILRMGRSNGFIGRLGRVGRVGGVVIADGNRPLPPPPPTITPIQHPPVHPQQSDSQVNRFITREHAISADDIRFVSVSSGRVHFIALDAYGQIWSWDNPSTGAGVLLKFMEGTKDLERKGHKVLRGLAGWGYSAAYLYGYGLVYWSKREEVKEGEVFALVHPQKIPDTGAINGNNRIVDFVVCDGFLVYLTADGSLYRNDLIGLESVPLTEFHKSLKEHADSLQPKFTRLSGKFNTFACFSNEDVVLVGTKENLEPQFVEELQGRQCISLAVGDYHLLALLQDGTLLSRGLESESCGCLGLGAEIEGAVIEGKSKRVRKFTKIDIEGKVLAIAAAGWQSSAIISE